MSVPISYLSVIIIWSTTPLAIKWSGHELGFELGVALRMLIGLAVLLLLLRLWKIELPWNRPALRVYAISGFSLYVAMSFVYWAAQKIPSGWISVIFGLSPIVTSLLAYSLLRDACITVTRSTGMALGLLGLLAVFAEGLAMSSLAMLGVAATLVSVFSQSLGAVLLKREQPQQHPVAITAGSIAFALPFFCLNVLASGSTDLLADSGVSLLSAISTQSIAAIIYLGIVGSALGFPLYFYLLKKLSPERVAIITLVTPITALLLGAVFNGEQITDRVWLGTSLIVTGLATYEYGHHLQRLVRRRPGLASKKP